MGCVLNRSAHVESTNVLKTSITGRILEPLIKRHTRILIESIMIEFRMKMNVTKGYIEVH